MNDQLNSQGRTAVVLAGGGVSGAFYEVGALLAFDQFLEGTGVNDFDLFVGTSAGAIVGALLANGITPETMLHVLDGRHEDAPGLQAADLFSFRPGQLLKGVFQVPALLAGVWASGLDLPQLMLAMTERLPDGLYDTRGVAAFLRRTLQALGGSEFFGELARELHIVATDLASGDRAVFGADHPSQASIPEAVAASVALPLVFKPVMVAGRLYADGGLRGNASLDVAVERGARLVVCVNPMVPYNGQAASEAAASDERLASAVHAWQVLRINAHAGLHYHLKHLRQRHPDVDFVLIEPRPDDAELLSGNIMHFPPRRDLVRHSYQTVVTDLAERQDEIRPLLARHGLALRASLAEAAFGQPLTGRLAQTLAELQATLEQ